MLLYTIIKKRSRRHVLLEGAVINYRGKKWVNYSFAKKQIFTVNPIKKNRDKAECNIKNVVFSKERPLIETINI